VSHDDRHAPLLARRIPRASIEIGRAYVIHARNGGIGVAVKAQGGQIGYRLHRALPIDRLRSNGQEVSSCNERRAFQSGAQS